MGKGTRYYVPRWASEQDDALLRRGSVYSAKLPAYSAANGLVQEGRKPIEPPKKQSRVPEGLWVKCPSCAQVIYNKDLARA